MRHHPHSANRQDSGEGPVALTDLARLRQGAYRLFSQSLRYPDEGRQETMATVAGELRGQGQVWASFPFFLEWDSFLQSLEEIGDRDPVSIQGEYVFSFLTNPSGVPCPIYESAYLGDDPSAAGWLLVRLESEYAKMGLSTVRTVQEAPDHVAVELEFMAFLCQREAEAWEENDLPQALQECRRQSNFLRKHLVWWVPEYARRLAALDQLSVFAAASRALWAFLVYDGDILDALHQRFEGVAEVP